MKLAIIQMPDIAAKKIVAESMLIKMFSIADGIFSMPPSMSPIFMKMDLKSAFSGAMFPFIIIFLFMDVFDTMGTAVAVSEQAGYIKDNKLPGIRKIFLCDSAGTLAGAMFGTSTVTSYVESCAGIENGGRTGLTSVAVSVLFILALFFTPIVKMIGSYPVITAPSLVIVGAMMIQNIKKIQWNDFSELFPAFLAMIGIPLSYSIADGLALGFIFYPVIKLFGGKAKEVPIIMYALGLVFIMYFILFRA